MKLLARSFRIVPVVLVVFALGVTSAALALPDGALDPTFDGDGWDFFNPAFATPADCWDMAVRADGKFAITGDVYSISPQGALSCVRNANGGTSTCITLHYDLGGQGRTYSGGIAVQSDDKAVIVGHADGPAAHPHFVTMGLRVTSANTLDGAFNGGSGVVEYDWTFDSEANTVTVVDDKIYLAGTVNVNVSGGNQGSDIFVMVRKADGTPETAFSGDGWAHAELPFIGIEEAYARKIAVDPLGRVVVAGGSFDAYDSFQVVRFTAAGDLDDSFGGDGRQAIPASLVGGNETLFVGGMAVDRFSRVVLVGKADTATGNRLVVVRLNAAGELDSSFGGGDGIANFAYGGTDDILLVQAVIALSPPSERLAILGDFDPAGADPDDSFLLVLTSAGTLDTSFNGTGKRALAPPQGPAWNGSRALVEQAGKLVALGVYNVQSNTLAWMARVQMNLIFGDDFDSGLLTLWSSVEP